MLSVNTDVIPTQDQIWTAQRVECVLAKKECIRKQHEKWNNGQKFWY